MSRPPFLQLPATARAYRLRTARGTFAVLDAGPPAAPRGTALLLPGFTGSKEDFVALLDPLARAGWRAVAVDGRGQYETGGPREEAAYALGELAADVLAQAAALGGPVHVVGHSFGGLVARLAVLGGGPWSSLTLISSGPAAIAAEERVRAKLLLDALRTMDMESIWHAIQALDAQVPDRDPAPDSGPVSDRDPVPVPDPVQGPDDPAPEMAALRLDVVETTGTAGAVPPLGVEEFLYQRWLANIPEQLIAAGRQLIDEPDRVAELAALALPKMVVSGEVDHAWPVPWLDEMAERLAARREVIVGAEHSPNAEQPHATAEVLSDFWTSVSR